MIFISIVIFSLLYLAPGDPARVLLGVKQVSPETLDAIRDQYHLNEPLITQYWIWLSHAVTLDFGDSIRTGESVLATCGPYLIVTLKLVLFSFLLSVILGIGLGTVSAKHKDKLSDKIISNVALVFTSAPSFAVGLLLIFIFGVKLGVLPIYGIGDGGLASDISHLLLPAITLTVAVSALLLRITRSQMLKETASDYVTFMRARAVAPYVITRSKLINASAPILTSMGLLLATLFSATLLVETTFAIPGAGGLLASSVVMKDVPVVQFLTLFLAFFIIVSQMICDFIASKIRR